MSLIDSLLSAVIRLDGDALVMHVGEKPYVVTSSSTELNAFRGPLAWGQVELSSKLLTTEAVSAMLDQLLPQEVRGSLEEVGAVEHELSHGQDGSRFVVIAARGGPDIWLEIRHVRPPAAAAAAQPAGPAETVPQASEAPRHVQEEPHTAQPAPQAVETAAEDVVQPEPSAPEPAPVPAEPAVAAQHAPAPEVALETFAEEESAVAPAPVASDPPPSAEAPPAPAAEPLSAPSQPEPQAVPVAAASPTAPIAMDTEIPELELVPDVDQEAPTQADVDAMLASTAAALLEAEGQLRLQEVESSKPAEHAEAVRAEVVRDVQLDLAALTSAAPAAPPVPDIPAAEEQQPGPVAEHEPVSSDADVAAREEERTSPAVVVPIARVVRETPPPQQVAAPSDLDRLLRIAAARGASALYTVARAKPVVRVDGEMQALDSEDLLTPEVVEAFTMSVAPVTTREAVRAGETTEWMCDMADVGRVRCLSFRDHRGPGAIFRMLPPRAISAEQLGLSKEIQTLSALPDGLVLLASPRGSGASTLVAAFVDLVNRTRSEHVVTIESQILFLHEAKRSFVSQREVRGRGDEMAAAARAALREDPDVLVIEELASADAVAAAVEAAQSGRLVFGGLRASTAEAAIERLLEQAPSERRPQLRSALASTLRGVVAQALLRKRGGGRVAARELLLNTPAVAALIAEGNLFQIRAALQSGRKLGMVPLNDALTALVRAGVVDPGEAHRKAIDREGLVAQLRREGIDTSFVERLA
jgi:twitching motility protein PilT